MLAIYYVVLSSAYSMTIVFIYPLLQYDVPACSSSEKSSLPPKCTLYDLPVLILLEVTCAPELAILVSVVVR